MIGYPESPTNGVTATLSDDDPRVDMEDRAEAERVLLGMADRKVGALPAELVVAHVMAVTEGGDWPVRRAAMEAVLRRVAFRERDELRVASRPGGGDVFGDYTTRRNRRAVRPYTTRLRSLTPLDASCDCNDFLRNSLGLCKHVVAVLENLRRGPRRWKRALDPDEVAAARPTAGLVWDPVRPLLGEGDWLARVEHVG